jgi:hypothetical protein
MMRDNSEDLRRVGRDEMNLVETALSRFLYRLTAVGLPINGGGFYRLTAVGLGPDYRLTAVGLPTNGGGLGIASRTSIGLTTSLL